ncbi:hypothetical protein [Pedobacter sp.]|uniref:hypothetical protein n=1 Tax=Pedobacter sp. TaxID=1411316 RepID=UPI003BA8CC90
MKKFIGTLIVLLSISFIGILILRVWDIYIISVDEIINSGYTLGLLGALIVVLIIAYSAFFKNSSKGYNKNIGNNAHPKL